MCHQFWKLIVIHFLRKQGQIASISWRFLGKISLELRETVNVNAWPAAAKTEWIERFTEHWPVDIQFERQDVVGGGVDWASARVRGRITNFPPDFMLVQASHPDFSLAGRRLSIHSSLWVRSVRFWGNKPTFLKIGWLSSMYSSIAAASPQYIC